MCGAPGRQGQTLIRALGIKDGSTSRPPPHQPSSTLCTLFIQGGAGHRHGRLLCHSVRLLERPRVGPATLTSVPDESIRGIGIMRYDLSIAGCRTFRQLRHSTSSPGLIRLD